MEATKRAALGQELILYRREPHRARCGRWNQQRALLDCTTRLGQCRHRGVRKDVAHTKAEPRLTGAADQAN